MTNHELLHAFFEGIWKYALLLGIVTIIVFVIADIPTPMRWVVAMVSFVLTVAWIIDWALTWKIGSTIAGIVLVFFMYAILKAPIIIEKDEEPVHFDDDIFS